MIISCEKWSVRTAVIATDIRTQIYCVFVPAAKMQRLLEEEAAAANSAHTSQTGAL